MPPRVRRCRCMSVADAVNERIRELVERGGEWPAEEYAALLEEWAAAQRGEYVEAA